MKQSVCQYCGKDYEDPDINPRRSCFECRAKNNAKAAVYRKEKFIEEFCPLDYQTSDPKLIPNPKKHAQVLAWQYGPKGMVLLGDSRSGKTRAMWMLLWRIYVAEGHTFEFFTGQSFAAEMSLSFKQDRYEDWFERVSNRKVVMFDDLDKTRFTDRVQAEIFSIVEYRLGRRLPIFISTNLIGDDLARTMNIVGIPLVARISEVCEPINFGG